MTGPAVGTGAGGTPSAREAQTPGPSTEKAPAEGTKVGQGTDAIGRDATQVAKDLTRQGVAPSSATAAGHAAAGSPESQADKSQQKGGAGAEDAQPDATQPGQGPVGMQQEAAFFTRNGSIEGNSIPSPTGPVPAGLIADDKLREQAIQAARQGAVDSHAGQSTGRFRLSEEAIVGMSPAELRAVAHDRGYRDIDGGRNAVRTRFIEAQKKDESLIDPPEGHRLGSGAARAPAQSTTVPVAALVQTGTLPGGGIEPTPAVGAASAAPATGAQASASGTSEAQQKGLASTHNTTDGKPVGASTPTESKTGGAK